jgi:hypothetical protein
MDIAIVKLKQIASQLVDNENVEYTRGICELIADCDGVEGIDHADRAMQIGIQLGLSENTVNKFY